MAAVVVGSTRIFCESQRHNGAVHVLSRSWWYNGLQYRDLHALCSLVHIMELRIEMSVSTVIDLATPRFTLARRRVII